MKTINVPTKNIYEFECEPDLLDRAFADFKTHKTEWIEDSTVLPGSVTLVGYLNKQNAVPWYHEELFNWMQTCLDEVAAATVKVPLAICDSWTTKTEYKQRSKMHLHSWSVFSGLLYFTEHKASTTMFEYNDHNRERFGKLFIDSKQGYVESAPKKGKFLIFPSDMYHFIQAHTEIKNTRYSLSFNTFFSGNITNEVTCMLQNNVVTVKDRYLKWKSEQG